MSCPPPGDLPDPRIKPPSPVSPALQVDSVPPGRKTTCSISDKEYLSQDRTKNFVTPELMELSIVSSQHMSYTSNERSLEAHLDLRNQALKEGNMPTFKLPFEVGQV